MVRLVTWTIVAILWPTVPTTAAELTQQEFLKLHAELQPNDSAPWRTIPWQTSLLDAQRIAAETKKPLFIWAMDGHPLGCT